MNTDNTNLPTNSHDGSHGGFQHRDRSDLAQKPTHRGNNDTTRSTEVFQDYAANAQTVPKESSNFGGYGHGNTEGTLDSSNSSYNDGSRSDNTSSGNYGTAGAATGAVAAGAGGLAYESRDRTGGDSLGGLGGSNAPTMGAGAEEGPGFGSGADRYNNTSSLTSGNAAYDSSATSGLGSTGGSQGYNSVSSEGYETGVPQIGTNIGSEGTGSLGLNSDRIGSDNNQYSSSGIGSGNNQYSTSSSTGDYGSSTGYGSATTGNSNISSDSIYGDPDNTGRGPMTKMVGTFDSITDKFASTGDRTSSNNDSSNY